MKMKMHDITAYNLAPAPEEIENYPFTQAPAGDTVFILNRESEEDEEVQEMLNKLSKAIGRENQGTTILALEKKKSFPYKRIIENEGIRYLVIFGMEPMRLALQVEDRKHQVIRMGERNLLFTHSASDLLNNKMAKAELWQALQEMYQLNKKS